jgi:polyisoprenoid-binding protein YceI
MALSGQLTAPAVRDLMADASLAGDWALDGARSTIGLRSSSIWGLAPVKGAFGRVTGHGTVSPAGEVSGTITVAAGSIETERQAGQAPALGRLLRDRRLPTHHLQHRRVGIR